MHHVSRRAALVGVAAFGAAAAPALAQRRPAESPTVDVAELMQAGPLGDVALGDANAPVTLVEYASLTCGHCASFHMETLPSLKQKYIEPGRVRLVFREFPLNPLDVAAYMLTRCALSETGAATADQLRYFALVEIFFARQRSWAFSDNPLAALTAISRQAGFTQAQFEACLNNKAILDGLNAVRERATTAFGVNSTPTFFLNGRRITGAQPLAEFERQIELLRA